MLGKYKIMIAFFDYNINENKKKLKTIFREKPRNIISLQMFQYHFFLIITITKLCKIYNATPTAHSYRIEVSD